MPDPGCAYSTPAAATATAAAAIVQNCVQPQRAKTASASHAGITAVPVFKGSQLLQLAALDFIADGGMTVPVIYGNGNSMALFDVIPGLVTPFPAPFDPDLPRGATTTTTFLTPEGHLVGTDPMSPREGATHGLVAVEVRASPTAAVGVTPSLSAGRIRTGGGSGILRGGRPSPAHSPTRQVSFVSSARMDAPSPSEGGMSPRMSRLRRSRTADELSVVMETALPPAQESALDSMRKLLMEENLAPQQQQTLDSVRSAMSRVKTSAAAANANANAKANAADVAAAGSKQEVRESADGSSRAALSSEEMLRTMTVFTLASQLSHEALQLGVRPESIFRNFGRLDTQVLSEIAPRRSVLGAGKVPRPEGVSTDTTQAELLLSVLEFLSRAAVSVAVVWGGFDSVRRRLHRALRSVIIIMPLCVGFVVVDETCLKWEYNSLCLLIFMIYMYYYKNKNKINIKKTLRPLAVMFPIFV